MSNAQPRRGEIWIVNLGEPPRRHWVLIVSIDLRNQSRFSNSVLIVPFGSKPVRTPSTMLLEAGETGLPGPSYLRGDLMQPLEKERLIERLPRPFSDRRMRQVCLAVRRSFDPDAPAIDLPSL